MGFLKKRNYNVVTPQGYKDKNQVIPLKYIKKLNYTTIARLYSATFFFSVLDVQIQRSQ